MTTGSVGGVGAGPESANDPMSIRGRTVLVAAALVVTVLLVLAALERWPGRSRAVAQQLPNAGGAPSGDSSWNVSRTANASLAVAPFHSMRYNRPLSEASGSGNRVVLIAWAVAERNLRPAVRHFLEVVHGTDTVPPSCSGPTREGPANPSLPRLHRRGRRVL